MNTFRKTALASAIVLGLGLSGAARADLIINASTDGVVYTQVADVAGNTLATYIGTFGVITFNGGALAFGNASNSVGALLDTSTQVYGSGSLYLQFTETNISLSGSNSSFVLNSTGNIPGATIMSQFFIDTANGGTEATLLGAPAINGGAILSSPVGLNGLFSLTEQVNITSRGGVVSVDDQVSVPEPAALSLLGLGLTAVAFARRRKSA